MSFKTDGGEELVQSSLTGLLAEVVNIYHQTSLGNPLSAENFNKLLQAVLNDSYPENYRIRMTTCFVEHAAKFPESMGDTLQTLLTIICFSSPHMQECALRSIPWLCRTMPEETRPRVVCEMSDVLLQVSMTMDGTIQQTANKSLEELLVLDSKAVVSKLFLWTSEDRVDEINAEVCAKEKSFALTKLREILFSKGDTLSVEVVQELAESLIEQLKKCVRRKDVSTIFLTFRGMKCFDDRLCARIISSFMTQACVEKSEAALKVSQELITLAPAAAKRVDEQLVSSFALEAATRKDIRLWECIATIASLLNEEAVLQIFPQSVNNLVQVLPDVDEKAIAKLPENLSLVEALLATFTQCTSKVPTLMLKLLEGRSTPGSIPHTFFVKLEAFHNALLRIPFDCIFASKKAVMAGSLEDAAIAEVPTCIQSLKVYTAALGSGSPRLPNPIPPFSWECPWSVPVPQAAEKPTPGKKMKKK